MALKTKIRVSLAPEQTGSHDFGGPVFDKEMFAAMTFLDGVGALQADLLFMDQRSVLTGANDDIDLAGVLLNAFGQTITTAELVGVFVINAPITGAPNTTNLTIGGGTNPVTGFLGGTTPTIGPLRPGAVVFLACPDAAGLGSVVAGTGDILRIANSAGATANYQIAILGRSS